jgi:DNA repair protein RecO (recombination protein O)
MLISTKAIVINTLKYGDNAVIAKLYTKQLGMVSFMVNGVYGKKGGNKSSFLQPLSLLEIVMQIRNNKSLQTLKEIKVEIPFSSIYQSPVKIAQSLFIAEVLYNTIKEEESNTFLFDFIHTNIHYLDALSNELPNFHLKFLLELSKYLGFYPTNNFTEKTPYFQFTDGVFLDHHADTCLDIQTSDVVGNLINYGLDQLHLIPLNRKQRQIILNHLVDYYRWHIPSLAAFKTTNVLEEVFIV